MPSYAFLKDESRRLLGHSYNHNFILRDAKGDLWVGKLVKRLKDICDPGNPDIYDSPGRTLCAYKFAELCRAPIAEYRRIKLADISNNQDVVDPINPADYYDFSSIAIGR